jgi:hypothetical protein
MARSAGSRAALALTLAAALLAAPGPGAAGDAPGTSQPVGERGAQSVEGRAARPAEDRGARPAEQGAAQRARDHGSRPAQGSQPPDPDGELVEHLDEIENLELLENLELFDLESQQEER